jgi:hypothetical protein
LFCSLTVFVFFHGVFLLLLLKLSCCVASCIFTV